MGPRFISPSGIEIYRDGKPVGKTPLMLEVRRKGGTQMLVAKKEGYNDQTLIMESRMGTGGVLDIISSATALTGVFGLTTDGLNALACCEALADAGADSGDTYRKACADGACRVNKILSSDVKFHLCFSFL